MTAQLECLLDDVVVGKQEMVGAIDAVCDVAQRIIGKLKEGAAAGGPPLLGASVGNGANAYWRWKSRPRGGRPQIDPARSMSSAGSNAADLGNRYRKI